MADNMQDDARRIVSYSKYPPLGTRGFGPMYSAHSFGTIEKDYAPQADDGLLTIVQIESRSAVENVEEIAKVEGIDILFIGACPPFLSLAAICAGCFVREGKSSLGGGWTVPVFAESLHL